MGKSRANASLPFGGYVGMNAAGDHHFGRNLLVDRVVFR